MFWIEPREVCTDPQILVVSLSACSSALLAHGFGLWDVVSASELEGRVDSAMRAGAANDFARLHQLCPLLETVGFNGKDVGQIRAAVCRGWVPDGGATFDVAGVCVDDVCAETPRMSASVGQLNQRYVPACFTLVPERQHQNGVVFDLEAV